MLVFIHVYSYNSSSMFTLIIGTVPKIVFITYFLDLFIFDSSETYMNVFVSHLHFIVMSYSVLCLHLDKDV